VKPTEATTLSEFVQSLGEAYGDRPAFVFDDESISFQEIEERSALVARGLLGRGVGKGSRIGLLFSNNIEWVISWAAIVRMGAVAIPLSTFSQPPELARVVRHADLQGLLAQRGFLKHDFVSSLEAAFPELVDGSSTDLRLRGAPFLRWIAFTGDAELPSWAHDYGWVLEGAARGVDDEFLRLVQDTVHRDEPAMFILTSGTSAEPKAVMHSQGGIAAKTHYIRDMLGFTQDSKNAATLPFFWVGGLIMTLFPTLEIGGTVVSSAAPPGQRQTMSSNDPAVLNSYPGLKKRIGLGMSETFGMFSWGDDEPTDKYPAITPLAEFEPGYRIKVVDDDGEQVDVGMIGELLIKGPTVTLGLHKVDADKSFDRDGFYRTGDLCEQGLGVLYFVGRKGDMIKTSGTNVAPAEVERELRELDGVQHAFVVDLDDEQRGSIVAAAVVLAEGNSLNAESITEILSSRLSSYKVPRVIVFVEAAELPYTPSNKIIKRDLQALVASRRS